MAKSWKTEDYILKKYNRHKEIRSILKLQRRETDKPKKFKMAEDDNA